MKDLFTSCGSGGFGNSEDQFELAWSFTTGLWTIGGAIGAVSGGPISNIRFIGRKRGLLVTCILMGLGSYLEAHPFFIYYQNSGYNADECNGAYDFILSGRFISGLMKKDLNQFSSFIARNCLWIDNIDRPGLSE